MAEKSSRYAERRRRFAVVLVLALAVVGFMFLRQLTTRQDSPQPTDVAVQAPPGSTLAIEALGTLAVRDRLPNTGYSRDQFGAGWASVDGCDTRNRILQRDLESEVLDADDCTVLTGTLKDPYTSKTIQFQRGAGTSDDVQIDHVVALSDAWQKGAQGLNEDQRRQFANDPLNLIATDGPTNQQKSDSDAAEWLPPESGFHCRYIARQIAVKIKYLLWVARSEFDVMRRTLETCPGQTVPS